MTLGVDAAAAGVSYGPWLAGQESDVGGHTSITVQERTAAQERALAGRCASLQACAPARNNSHDFGRQLW